MGKTCGQCKWWERAKPYAFGNCYAPLPLWAVELAYAEGSAGCDSRPSEAVADDCACFQPAENIEGSE